jgi:hypothetical protein
MLSARQAVHIAAVSMLFVIQEPHAQSPAGGIAADFVSKDELQKLVSGKSVRWIRAQDGASMVWAISADQSFNTTSLRPGARGGGRDSGTWEMKDDGGLCLKWKSEGDRPCVNYYFKKQGAKYLLYTNPKPDAAALGEVGSID